MVMQTCAFYAHQLLLGRAQFKRAARTRAHTEIQLRDNNPLRWAPTPQDAMDKMFVRPTRSYLDARHAFEHSFETLKTHQTDTFAAVQEAIQFLLTDLDPELIARDMREEGQKPGFLGGTRTNKARMWDEFAARWKAKTGAQEGGLHGAFMLAFGEAYDRRERSGAAPAGGRGHLTSHPGS